MKTAMYTSTYDNQSAEGTEVDRLSEKFEASFNDRICKLLT